eukprot:TRINITY_DN29680_c0_g1_i1.p1 TRINITY_DN29680_c0_g1~~TRINITY_DN29680_c0_g1_i1.p1  ORF type:complete len:324 (+),score=50.33 TRINITY_DN29680_c0_g1_i1:71-1042(+)
MLAPSRVKIKRADSEESIQQLGGGIPLTPRTVCDDDDRGPELSFKLPDTVERKDRKKDAGKAKKPSVGSSKYRRERDDSLVRVKKEPVEELVKVKTERKTTPRKRTRRRSTTPEVKRERDTVVVKREKAAVANPTNFSDTRSRARKPPMSMQYRVCALHLDVLRTIGNKEAVKDVFKDILRLLGSISPTFKSEIIVLLKLVEIVVARHGTLGLSNWAQSTLTELQQAFTSRSREDGASLCSSTLQFIFSSSRTRCYKCGEPGHIASSCTAELMEIDPGKPMPPDALNAHVSLRHCHHCGEPGHLQSNCPNRRGPRTGRMDLDK